MSHTTVSPSALDRPPTLRPTVAKAAPAAEVACPAIYRGFVMHERLTPKAHRFLHAFYFYAVDLDDLANAEKNVAGFGVNRFRPVSLHEKDYINDSPGSLRDKLTAWLSERGYKTDFARIKLVTAARYFNYVFNPVSFYLCYARDGSLDTVVAEVNNTFRERHFYVADDLMLQDGTWFPRKSVRKEFHVSPFNDLEGEYAFRVTEEEDQLSIGVDILKNGETVFRSELCGSPEPLTTASLWRTVVRAPFRPLLTFPRITWEALKLYAGKKLTFFHKPVPRSPKTISTAKPSLLQSLVARPVLHMFAGIRKGQIIVTMPDGSSRTFGAGDASGMTGRIRIRDHRFFTRLLFRGSIGLGEAYVKEYWQSDDPAAALLPMALSLNDLEKADGPTSVFSRIADALSHRTRRNSRKNSRKNIHDHYDLGNDFYETFLDPTMTYSSAVYRSPEDMLEQAQLNKLDAIIEKADIQADHHILEIGSGWGSLAIRAARTTGCRVTTITLSEEQQKLAMERVREAGLDDRVDVRICDYRDIEGRYDRVVSIEMIEAVGHEYFAGFFRKCRGLLKPGGRLVMQAITIPDERYDRYHRSCDWIQKYIFPGGHLPSMKAFADVLAETKTFSIASVDSIGLDYAKTLNAWRERFMSRLSRVRELGYNEEFIRKWEYYLAYCEAGFAARAIDTVHLVLLPRDAREDQESA